MDSVLVIKKLTVGVVPVAQMFRVASLSGQVADEIIVGLKDKPIRDPEYFTELNAPSVANIQLRNKERGNYLLLNSGNVVFTQEKYKAHVDADKFVEEFAQLWHIIDEILEVQQIRRIGMVAEHRVFNVDDPSKVLQTALTKYPTPDNVGKFYCTFEKRIPLARGASQLNVKVDAFTNVLHQFYDAEMDPDVPESNAYNVNLDVQRYYTDETGDKVLDEVRSLKSDFEKHWREFQAQIKALGLAK
jgi:hypothetical protein